MTKFHSEQKVTVTMEFDKSILTVSFFLMTLKWMCFWAPTLTFLNQEELIPINFFIHNYIIHKKNQKV